MLFLTIFNHYVTIYDEFRKTHVYRFDKIPIYTDFHVKKYTPIKEFVDKLISGDSIFFCFYQQKNDAIELQIAVIVGFDTCQQCAKQFFISTFQQFILANNSSIFFIQILFYFHRIDIVSAILEAIESSRKDKQPFVSIHDHRSSEPAESATLDRLLPPLLLYSSKEYFRKGLP